MNLEQELKMFSKVINQKKTTDLKKYVGMVTANLVKEAPKIMAKMEEEKRKLIEIPQTSKKKRG